MSIKPMIESCLAVPRIEGAGAHLHRAFGFSEQRESDPFLLFDDFRNDDPTV